MIVSRISSRQTPETDFTPSLSFFFGFSGAQKSEAPSQKAGLRAAGRNSVKRKRLATSEELGFRLATITLQLPRT